MTSLLVNKLELPADDGTEEEIHGHAFGFTVFTLRMHRKKNGGDCRN